MVEWSENNTVNVTSSIDDSSMNIPSSSDGNYGPSNFLMWIATIPLFVTVMYSDPTRPKSKWLSSYFCRKRSTYGNNGYDSDDDDDYFSDDDDDDDDDDEEIIYEETSLL